MTEMQDSLVENISLTSPLHRPNYLEGTALSEDEYFREEANKVINIQCSNIDFSIWLEGVSFFDITSNDIGNLPKSTKAETRRKRWLLQFHGAWRTGVAAGMLITFFVFLINLGVFIWISVSISGIKIGSTIAYEGSCVKMKKISAWCHLVINIFSTLLLGASNNCMQCLVCPTRAEIDFANSRETWLDIGVPSIRDLKFLAR